MTIPERDLMFHLFTYLRSSTDIHRTGISPIKHKIDHIQVKLIQLKTFKPELDFAEHISLQVTAH